MADAAPQPPRPRLLAQWLSRSLGAPCEIAIGLPERAQDDDARRGPGVWLGVEDLLAPAQHVQLWLDAALALQLVDLGLGGEGGPPPPAGHPAAALDDAERGVLAYVAARACTALGGRLRLTGVHDGHPGLAAGRLRFPVAVRIGEHTAAAAAWLDGEAAARWLPPPALRWVLAADDDEGGSEQLAPGDVLLLPPGPPAGFLRVEGLEGLRAVRRDGDGLRGRPAAPPAQAGLRVELDAGVGTWDQVAELMAESGHALVPTLGGPAARVMGPGGREWGAELVRLDGRLGVRITAENPRP